MFKVLRDGLLRYILYTCPKSIVMNLTTCTHGAHKIHSGKTAKDLYLTTCTHGGHKIHSCKNKGVHTAKPFRVYRRGPWPRVQTRPLPLRPWQEPSACTCDPGLEPSACTCDPRKRVHSRPPDLFPLLHWCYFPETNSKFGPENGWLLISFPFGAKRPIFRGAVISCHVSFRECKTAGLSPCCWLHQRY